MDDDMHRRRWQPGDQILVEMIGFGVPFLSVPTTVVSDTPELLVFFVASGTTYRTLALDDGTRIPRVVRPDDFERLATRYVLERYEHRNRLVVARPDRAYAIYVNWNMPGWDHYEWYVNMQTPFQRTENGFHSTDQVLDIIVYPDFSWTWKDEDELEESVEARRLSRTEADAARREGERVVRDIEARAWPFSAGYENWRPDPSWGIPAFPDDWDLPQGSGSD